MRTIVAAAILAANLAVFSSPVVAQSAQPTYLYLLEGRGVPTGTVHGFSVNTSMGSIAEVPGSPFNAGMDPALMVIDPTGRFLYVANQLSQDITAFSIDASTGTLTAMPGSPFSIGSQPQAMGVDPTGRFLYVAAIHAQRQSLYEFTIDPSTGVLTSALTSPQAGLWASSIAFDPVGGYAYLSQGSPDPGTLKTILVCSINFSTGMLIPVGSVRPSSGGASAVTVSPDGNFLYSVDSADSELDAYSVSSVGLALTESPGSPYPVPFNPYSLIVHPSGSFLYVVNENHTYQTNYVQSQYEGSISTFAIDPATRALTQVPGSPLAAGTNPLSVVVDPTGRFVYTTSTTYTNGYLGFAQIAGFSIDPSSGSLTPFPGYLWTDSAHSTGGQLAITSVPATPSNPVPMIASLSPPSTIATGAAFSLQVNGVNFVPGATVYFGGQPRSTTFVSSTQLNAAILGSDIANSGTAVVFVFNPLPGGGASGSVAYPVSAPVPSILSIGPSSVVAGGKQFTLFARGIYFVSSSVINLNGIPVPTSYSGPTLLLTEVLPPQIAAPGTVSVTVTSPANGVAGGGTSNTATLTILPPVVPVAISSISPASASAGGPAFALIVKGSGFVPGSQVTFDLNDASTTFVSSTQLTASIAASAIATAGNKHAIVTNPDGSTSASLTFTVNNPTPLGSTVFPASLPAGGGALTLNVAGAGFTQHSEVLVNGSARATTYVSATLLQAALLAGDLAKSGTLNITVSNPPPGGGTTPSMGLTVADYNVSAPNPSQTISAGQQGNYSLILTALNRSLGNSVSFTASGLPPGTSASFSPPVVAAGGSSSNVMFSVVTTLHSSGSNGKFATFGWPYQNFLFSVALAIGMMWLAVMARRGRARHATPLLLVLLSIAVAAGLNACSSTVGAPATPPSIPATGTPAGAYTLTVNATSGSVTISTKVLLTVM